MSLQHKHVISFRLQKCVVDEVEDGTVCDCYRKEDSDDETLREIDALLTSKAADDDQLTAVDGVDLGSHLDVFHTILKQVAVNFFSFHDATQQSANNVSRTPYYSCFV